MNQNQNQKQEMLTIVCISDTHCHEINDLPAGDILIHCGDISKRFWQEKEIDDFIKWISKQQFDHKIVIAGNHDGALDSALAERIKSKKDHIYLNFDHIALKERLKKCCHYLENSSVTVEGYKFWGSPYSLEFFGAFQIKPKDAEEFWKQIDKDSEIILTHGPPYYYGDKIMNGTRVGDKALLDAVTQIRPKLHIFGHVHEGYGVFEEDGGVHDEEGIKFINCSINTHNYQPINAPIVIKVPKKKQ